MRNLSVSIRTALPAIATRPGSPINNIPAPNLETWVMAQLVRAGSYVPGQPIKIGQESCKL
jgi:hypothetical protein